MGANAKRKGQRLGQHFLMDSAICSRIVTEAKIQKDDFVLEIGPGAGALTGILYSMCASRLTLIEPDEKLLGKLQNRYPEAKLIAKRAEDVNFNDLPGPLVVVSNLPYYASVHILKHCTDYRANISRMILMFQKEVARRINALPGRKAYGSLSVFSRYHWEMEELMTIEPSAFKPPPRVHSVLLRFLPHHVPPVETDEEKFFGLVREAFTHKRRTLRNNLKGFYTSDSIDAAYAAAGLDARVRAEAVTLEEFAAMLPCLIVETNGKGRAVKGG
ncbi:MAG: ribosomal RNA small subunit methyltransferase A [bacterium]|nr:MAG: ribosomal RNA small subunit methyltransferase A [bacterium]